MSDAWAYSHLSSDRCPICGDGLFRNRLDQRRCECGYFRDAPPADAASLAIFGEMHYPTARRWLDYLTCRLTVGKVIGMSGSKVPPRWAFERRINLSMIDNLPRIVMQSASHVISFGNESAYDVAREIGVCAKLIQHQATRPPGSPGSRLRP